MGQAAAGAMKKDARSGVAVKITGLAGAFIPMKIGDRPAMDDAAIIINDIAIIATKIGGYVARPVSPEIICRAAVGVMPVEKIACFCLSLARPQHKNHKKRRQQCAAGMKPVLFHAVHFST